MYIDFHKCSFVYLYYGHYQPRVGPIAQRIAPVTSTVRIGCHGLRSRLERGHLFTGLTALPLYSLNYWLGVKRLPLPHYKVYTLHITN